MSGNYFLVVDVGTQSIRTAVISEGLEVLAVHSDPQDITIYPDGNRIEVNMPFVWESVCKGCRETIRNAGIVPEQIKAVCTGAIMHCPVPIDRGGNLLLKDVQIYSDKRCNSYVEAFSKSEYAERAYEYAGSVATASWMGFKIRWIRHNQPKIYEKVWKFLSANSWLNYQLTGCISIDHTEASGTYIVNRHTGEYDWEMAEWVGIDIEKMPPIFNSRSVIGVVSNAAAQNTGLAEGTLVVAGSGDMGCAALGGNLIPGDGIITTGTASGIDRYHLEPLMDKKLINLRHVIDGWLSFGSVECGGGSMRWLKNALFAVDAANEDKNLNKEIDKLAAQVRPGADGLLYMPQLLGERENLGSPRSKGAFIGLSMNTGISQLCRAVLEGVCYAERRILDVYQSRGMAPTFLYSRGGGSNSKVWNQIRSDIFQVPIHVLEEGDNTGLLGAAILAGHAAGVYDSIIEVAKHLIRVKEVYTPNAKNAGIYTHMFRAYCNAHDVLYGTYDILALARRN